ncbi:hypothetical protein V8G54_000690 [Vigna mungo]|uniref:Uncharacterized protein n=1 Tax=Vigna mungo TaxID=3915 RepID=A0AAQ3P6Z0_VIGMU
MASGDESYIAGETNAQIQVRTYVLYDTTLSVIVLNCIRSDLTVTVDGLMDQEKAKQEIGQVGQKAQEKSDETKEWASEMGRCMKEWAQYGKENTCGFLQGVSDSVKNSFGMAPQNDEDEEYYYYYPTQNRRE